jgi:hypothetical protein
MCAIVDYGQVWWSSDSASLPPIVQWHRIEDCHEWDGLFSISASNGAQRLFLTAFCDNSEEGSFNIEENGARIAEGKTRVTRAPTLVEDDGYTFPAGAYFGAGNWEVECEASGDRCYRVIAEVRHWKSTD